MNKPTPSTESCFRFHRDLDGIIKYADGLCSRFDSNEGVARHDAYFANAPQDRDRAKQHEKDWSDAKSLISSVVKIGGWLHIMVRDLDATKDRLRLMDSPVARDIVARCARAEEVAERNAKEREGAQAEVTRLRAALSEIAALQLDEPSESAPIERFCLQQGLHKAAQMARATLEKSP